MREQRTVAAGQQIVNDLVEALLAVVIYRANRAGERALDAGARHERIERRLRAARLDDALDVVDEHVFRLRREVEDHVGVH